MAKKKGGSAGAAAAVRRPKGKRGNGAQLKQKKDSNRSFAIGTHVSVQANWSI